MRGRYLAAVLVMAAAGVRAEPVLVQAEAQTLTPFCAARDVQIEGNHNVVKPAGACHSLLLKGIGNTIIVDLAAGATIRVEGGENRVTYHAPTPPEITVLGLGNTVFQPTPPEPDDGNLHLVGDDRAQEADCTGRNVTIEGDRSLYVLRGGCRSVSVHGDLVMVQAELQPNAAIALTGHGSEVGWAIDGPGRLPAPKLHGVGNRVVRLADIGGGALP